MEPDDKKPLNYWQQDPNEQPVQHAPEQMPDEPSATPSQDATLTDGDPVNWDAKEFIHMERGPLWFVAFAFIALGLIALDVFLIKSWSLSVLVVIMAIPILIYVRRPPRTLHYALSITQGLYIGEHLYPFEDYKAFGLIRDGEHFSIMLIPVKRFSTGVSVYFPEEAGEKIIDILGQRLPMEDLKLDAIDILIRKIRL